MHNEISVKSISAVSQGSNRVDMSFEPKNQLEELLIKAATNPSARPRFLKSLLESEIFIVQNDPPVEESDSTKQFHTETIELDDGKYLPVFSSPERLQSFKSSDTGYLSVNGRTFLKATRGINVLLNPGLTYARIFTSEEIADLLDGAIWLPPEPEKSERETQIMIGQPANYPTELVETLKRFFKRRDEVKRAWLGHIYNPETDESAHSLVAIEVDDNWDEVSSQTGTVASAVAIPDPPVDILQISGNGGIEDYFLNNVEPFYVRDKSPQVS